MKSLGNSDLISSLFNRRIRIPWSMKFDVSTYLKSSTCTKLKRSFISAA